MGKQFVDRKEEVEYLRDSYSSGQAELVVLYGRRRVGKTYLLTKGLDVPSLYLLAEESETVLEDFSECLAREFGDRVIGDNPLMSWKAFFTYIGEKAEKERLLVILDEVQYIAHTYKPFMSVLQKHWDTLLKNTKLMLVLCGSLVSFMEGTLSGKSPIYGRRTGTWKLEPLRFLDLRSFHPLDTEEAFKVYSVFGGVPQYWRDYDPGKTLWENLDRLLFSKGARYYDEPRYLLREEIREVSRYFSILKAVANGATTFGNISSRAKVNVNSLGKYLSILENMGFIKKEEPVIGKKGRYVVNDNLFHFWFKFVYPAKNLIEMGEDPAGDIKNDFNTYLGGKYEHVAKEFLEALNKRGELPFKFSKIGRWWHKGDEIDLVGLKGKKGMFFEVKWSDLSGKEVERTINDLKRKAERFDLQEVHFGLVTKSAPKRDLVFTLDDISEI